MGTLRTFLLRPREEIYILFVLLGKHMPIHMPIHVTVEQGDPWT